MEVKLFKIPVDELLKDFLSAIQPLQSHNYNIDNIFEMVINSLKADNQLQMEYICRFCMYFSADSTDPVRDTQIMTTAIMDLRNDLFRFFKLYNLVDMNRLPDPFPYGFRFHSLKYNILTMEVTKP